MPLQNEKKKDKDLTQRIEKILAIRDDALRGADIGKLLPSYSLTYLEAKRLTV